MRPNFDPRRTKIDVENEIEKRRLLKIVLEPSWVDLGSSWVPSWGQNRALALGGARFFENRLFEENEGSRGDLGRSWVDLGRPRGVKMRAAEGQKRSYVEMILSSEVEVKLRCDLEWRRALEGSPGRMVQGGGRGRGDMSLLHAES